MHTLNVQTPRLSVSVCVCLCVCEICGMLFCSSKSLCVAAAPRIHSSWSVYDLPEWEWLKEERTHWFLCVSQSLSSIKLALCYMICMCVQRRERHAVSNNCQNFEPDTTRKKVHNKQKFGIKNSGIGSGVGGWAIVGTPPPPPSF